MSQLEKAFDKMNMPPNAQAEGQGEGQGQGQDPGGESGQAGASQVAPPDGDIGSSTAVNTSGFQARVSYSAGTGFTSMADVASPHPNTLQSSDTCSTAGPGSQVSQSIPVGQPSTGLQSQTAAQGTPPTGHVRQTVAAINQGQAGTSQQQAATGQQLAATGQQLAATGQQQAATGQQLAANGQQQATGGYGQPQQPGLAAGGQPGQVASRDQQQQSSVGGYKQNVAQQNQPYLGPASARPTQQQAYVPLSERHQLPASGSQSVGSQSPGYASEAQKMKSSAQGQLLPQEQYSYPPSYQASTGASKMTVAQAQQGYYSGVNVSAPQQVTAPQSQVTASQSDITELQPSLSDTEWLKNFRKVCALDAVQFADIWTLYDSDGKSII